MNQPTPQDLSCFNDMGAAKAAFGGSKYFQEGTYIARVDSAILIPKTKGKGKGFKLDFTIIACVAVPDGMAAHKPGEVVSWMQLEGQWPESWLSRCKTPLMVILGKTEAEVDGALMAEVLGAENPMAGYCVQVQTIKRPKKDQPVGATVPVMTSVTNFQRFVPGEEIVALLKGDEGLTRKLYPNGIDAPTAAEQAGG